MDVAKKHNLNTAQRHLLTLAVIPPPEQKSWEWGNNGGTYLTPISSIHREVSGMKKLFVIVVLLLSVLLMGCLEDGTPGTDAGITGYVMKIEEARILVVEPEVKDFSSTGGIDEFYNAIWFSNAPQDIAIGDKVKVWFDFVLDSYPGQSEIEHLEVVPSPKPDGANLHLSEALQKALTSVELNDVVTVVKSIEYNAEKKQWVIELKECWGDETHTIG